MKKIVLLQRVITNYRLPIFNRINKIEGYDLTVYYGPDFVGTKLENTKKRLDFKSHKLFSIPLRFRTKNGLVAMPYSPFLLFNLIWHNPSILICEGASNLLNTSSAYIYKILFRKKMIWWSLGSVPNRPQSFIRRLSDGWIKKMERNADAIIAYNTHAKEYFLKEVHVPESRIFVALNVIDTDTRLIEAQQFDKISIFQEAHIDYDFIVLYVGAITEGKRLDVLLHAFKKLEQAAIHYRVKLTIVGKGESKASLETLAQSLSIRSIEFTGEVQTGVSRYFFESDIFVLPGLGGLAIPDAMVHGLPVIADSADGSEKDFIDGKNGFIIPNMDADKLYMALQNLCENRIQLNEMKIQAFATIQDRYNINTFMRQVKNAIYSIS